MNLVCTSTYTRACMRACVHACVRALAHTSTHARMCTHCMHVNIIYIKHTYDAHAHISEHHTCVCAHALAVECKTAERKIHSINEWCCEGGRTRVRQSNWEQGAETARACLHAQARIGNYGSDCLSSCLTYACVTHSTIRVDLRLESVMLCTGFDQRTRSDYSGASQPRAPMRSCVAPNHLKRVYHMYTCMFLPRSVIGAFTSH